MELDKTTITLSDASHTFLGLMLQSPNFIGVPMGILQLALYCIYRRSDGAAGKLHDTAIDQEKGLKAVVAMPPQQLAGTKPEAEGQK